MVSPLDGNTYSGTMAGRSPFYNGHRTTTVNTYLVPVIIHMPDGSTFDAGSYDPCLGDSVVNLVQGSPNYTGTDWIMNGIDIGVTQYADAFQRANFWQYVAPSAGVVTPYHTLLGYNLLPAVNVTVPAGKGYTQLDSCPYAVIDYNWFDNYITSTLIPSLAGEGVGPTSLPVFVFDSVVMYLNGNANECCALGNHGSYLNSSNLLQTYVVADFDSSGYWDPDITWLSHELGEWINDPTNSNPAPAWGNVGKHASCEATLEVGDPLSGFTEQTLPMPNGKSYNVQELVFFSWFYDQSPSIAAGGLYSDFGTFVTPNTSVCH